MPATNKNIVPISGAATGTVADVGRRADVERVFADLEEAHGGLDVLVNNAGTAGPTAPVDDHDEAAWPDDVADTVLFLASDAAKKISGQSISVDG